MAAETSVRDAPYAEIDLAPAAVEIEALAGGGWRLWNPEPLAAAGGYGTRSPCSLIPIT